MPTSDDSEDPDAPDLSASTGGAPSGGLYLVATPIGNLGDLTARAARVLGEVDLVACEDTRVTGKLMRHLGLSTPMLAYHEHNAEAMRPRLLARLAAGGRVALASDAGMPLISDPGYKLVRAAIAAGHPVTVAPGANAALTALVLSGLPCDRFLFIGFPPAKSSARRRALEEVAEVRASLILYEAAPRLAACLADLAATLGGREAAVARELTKRFEEVRRGTLPDLAAHYAAAGPPRGEIVVVVGPPEAPVAPDAARVEALLSAALAEGVGVKEAAARVARETGLPRRDLYRLALERGDE